jgi:hypothetical protein
MIGRRDHSLSTLIRLSCSEFLRWNLATLPVSHSELSWQRLDRGVLSPTQRPPFVTPLLFSLGLPVSLVTAVW